MILIEQVYEGDDMALEKAVKEGFITMNPAIGCKLPPKKAREMQVLTHDEMQRFLFQAKHNGYYEIFLLVEVTVLEPAASCSQMVKNT